VMDAGADFIVRTGWNSLRLLQANGKAFDLFAALAAQVEQESEVQVRIHEGEEDPSEPLMLRLVIRRKDPEQAEADQKRLLKDARKRGKQPDPRSLEAAKYILLLTSLPAATFPPADILAIYRFRWQIELAFKRFKSLAGLDMLPAKKPELARAWIYARLIVAIIAEQIAGQVPDSSPSGPDITTSKSIALASHEDSVGHNRRRHSRTTPVADRLQPLQPNPSSPLRAATAAAKTMRLPPRTLNLAQMTPALPRKRERGRSPLVARTDRKHSGRNAANFYASLRRMFRVAAHHEDSAPPLPHLRGRVGVGAGLLRWKTKPPSCGAAPARPRSGFPPRR
jgi:hypothetical protein